MSLLEFDDIDIAKARGYVDHPWGGLHGNLILLISTAGHLQRRRELTAVITADLGDNGRPEGTS